MSKPRRPPNRPPPVFLISTGRTGTKFFARFFQRHIPDAATHHITRGTRRQNVLNGMAALGFIPQRIADWWLAHNTIRRIQNEPKRWIECNPYYFNSISQLRAYFPDARFIFVIRHPRTFCKSHIRWERQRFMSRIANQLVPFWAPVPYHEQLLGLTGSYHQRVRYYAKVWLGRNTRILSQLDRDPSAITLRFEDIFASSDGPSHLRDLLDKLDCGGTDVVGRLELTQKENHSISRNPDEPWDSRCDEVINRVCGQLMPRFDYV